VVANHIAGKASPTPVTFDQTRKFSLYARD